MEATRETPPAASLWIVAGLTVMGLALRLPSFDDSFFGDELSSYFVVHGFGLGNVIDLVESEQEGTPPLYFLLAWLTKSVGSPAEGLRVVSMLAGLAAIPLTYLLGLRTVGSRAALVGSALVSLSPFLIVYASEGRAYSLMMLFCLLSTLSLVTAIERQGPGWWVAYAVFSAGAMYSHYTAAFVLFAQFAWALLAVPPRRRAVLLASLGAVVIYLPWVPGYLEDRDQPAAHVIESLHPLSLDVIKTDVAHTAFGHSQTSLRDLPGEPALLAIAVGLAFGLVAIVLMLRAREGPSLRPPKGVVLVTVLALATPAGAALYSVFADSVFLPRNLIASWPGFALTLGAFLSAGRGRLRTAAVAMVVAGFAVGGLKMLDGDQQRPDYLGVAEFIRDQADPGAPVVEVPAPSPGPQTSLEAHLALEGEPFPAGYPVLALGQPTLKDRLASRGEGGGGPLAALPVPEQAETAVEAVNLAHGGKIFLTVLGRAPIEELRSSPLSGAAGFLAALPPAYQEVDSRTFPGFWIFPVTVHVLDRTSPGGAAAS